MADNYNTLTPSQAIVGQRHTNNNAMNSTSGPQVPVTASSQSAPSRRRRGNRNRGRKQGGPKAETQEEGKQQHENSNNTAAPSTIGSSGNKTTGSDVAPNTTDSAPTAPNLKKANNRNRNRNRKAKKANETQNSNQKQEANSQQQVQGPEQNEQGNKGNNNRNKKAPRKKYPWRRFIPSGTVDPITLESLVSLNYPPFALVADAPYEPVPVWPIPANDGTDSNDRNSQVDIEELNRKRIAEQWGSALSITQVAEDDKKQSPPLDPSKRHYNLYDGRALAYYIVSQLQFIDPLNRRDLTRDELLNLDAYLRRHGFKDINVTEAYDAKGITISSAGAAAATAQGRADIMQQMARNLLNSLFTSHSVSAMTPRQASASTSRGELSLQEQYAELQRQENARTLVSARMQTSATLNPEAVPFFGNESVIISDDGGFVVIDDDENPGMRGGNYDSLARSQPSGANPLYSASHITARYGHGGMVTRSPDAFPALPTPSMTTIQTANPTQGSAVAVNNASTSNTNSKPSKTLARITGAVKKTDPEEQQRQWEAREAARKRAMMANLSFGVDASAMDIIQQKQGLLRPPPGISLDTPHVEISEEKLQRNKAFADALGVKPATVRQSINSGWARPTETQVSLDEFGNELNAVIYPDSLIVQARDRMGLLLKLEKKWKSFLQDDNAASLPLNPMDKPTRTFVHHYSDFWNLKTESFDPEPRRYIHCVKTLDTHMPYPLLSDATRKWRGPSQFDASSSKATQQPSGQPSKSREIPPPQEYVSKQLNLPTSVSAELLTESNLASTRMRVDVIAPTNSRFAAVVDNRERPKIELAKRTVPLELPPFEPPGKANAIDSELLERRARHEDKIRRAKEEEQRKRQAIQDAFASDDEEDNDDESSQDTEWEEPEPVYKGSDDDEE